MYTFHLRVAWLVAKYRVSTQGDTDPANDEEVGFWIITSEDVYDLGTDEVIKRIRSRIGNNPVYLR